MGTDLMINRNKLDYNCTALTPSTSLCLQDTCTIKTLDRTYTCDELVRNQNFYLAQLIAWNPYVPQCWLIPAPLLTDCQVYSFQVRQFRHHDWSKHLSFVSLTSPARLWYSLANECRPPGGGSFDVNITISQQPTPTLSVLNTRVNLEALGEC